MAIDTPARLAILGAGPIGLDAALYARFLGYDVVIYERGQVAERVRQLGDTRMESPFRENHTTLGMAAIQAQDDKYCPPADDALLTNHEWLSSYLIPLSQTDLLSDHFRLQSVVLNVENLEPSYIDSENDDEGGGIPAFRVITRDASGSDEAELFHGILDCTGAAEIYTPGCQLESGYHLLRATGYGQIREVFTIIGDRATLDLYSSAARLVR